MAKPNYQFEKRQRDLAKKKKKEEKLLKKQQAKGVEGVEEIAGAAGARRTRRQMMHPPRLRRLTKPSCSVVVTLRRTTLRGVYFGG